MKASYRQAIFLNSILNQLSITSFPQEKRGKLFDIKRNLEPVISKYKEEMTILLLLNGGIEKETQEGKIISKPELPTRSNQNDSEYKTLLQSHFDKVRKIDEEIQLLDASDISYKIPAIFTPEEFEELQNKIGMIEFVTLQDLLTIKDK